MSLNTVFSNLKQSIGTIIPGASVKLTDKDKSNQQFIIINLPKQIYLINPGDIYLAVSCKTNAKHVTYYTVDDDYTITEALAQDTPNDLFKQTKNDLINMANFDNLEGDSDFSDNSQILFHNSTDNINLINIIIDNFYDFIRDIQNYQKSS